MKLSNEPATASSEPTADQSSRNKKATSGSYSVQLVRRVEGETDGNGIWTTWSRFVLGADEHESDVHKTTILDIDDG